jgi:hypothetical protein
MAMKALLHGNAGPYELRGAIWEFGFSAYRAYVHLVPTAAQTGLTWSVVSAEGSTVKDVLSATETNVESAIGRPVETLEVVAGAAATPEPDTAAPRDWPAPRRYPPPTD